MLRPRIIPCLLVKGGALVKTTRFADPTYVGDPMNAVRIYNEKRVDELIVVDIDATRERRGPDLSLVRKLASECRMPLCYGGGVRTVEQASAIIALGVEKVAIGASAAASPRLVSEIAAQLGSQSVVAVLDVRRHADGRYEVFTHNATRGTGIDPVSFAQRMQDAGAGEILLNSIDRDGTMQGYDLDLARAVRERVGIPMSVLGGAGSLKDIGALVAELGTIGAAAGSLFVFKGKYRAVLISYPRREEKDQLLGALSHGGAGAR